VVMEYYVFMVVLLSISTMVSLTIEKNNEFLITTLDMSFTEKYRLLCDWIGWNLFEIKIEIT
jgi:hypothetical protein